MPSPTIAYTKLIHDPKQCAASTSPELYSTHILRLQHAQPPPRSSVSETVVGIL